MVMRLGDLAADTSGSTQITETMAGYAIAATAFSGSRWLSGDQEVRCRGDKFTSREASDDMKSALHRQTQLTFLLCKWRCLLPQETKHRHQHRSIRLARVEI